MERISLHVSYSLLKNQAGSVIGRSCQRSQIDGLRREQLTVEPPIPVEGSSPLPSLAIHLGRTKTTSGEDNVVCLTGRPVEALNTWMTAVKVDSGSVFRATGRLGDRVAAPDRSAISQRHDQAAGGDGWAGAGGVFRAWVALRLSHRGGQPWHSAPRGNRTITASIRATSIELL